jgi:lipopolysaccharide export system permease protein
LHRYVLREFLLSLLVAFLFFFFIFFVNQILLFAQRILLRQVHLTAVLKLVLLSMPQILLYTIPFSTLSASSMTIGDFAARNELLALRATGIALGKLFQVIAIIALFLAVVTFAIADILLPYSHQQFRRVYSELLQEIPTLELDSYAINQSGDTILVTGEVKEGHISSLVLFNTPNQRDQQVISSSGGTITLVDPSQYLYRLDLLDPTVLQTQIAAQDQLSLASGKRMTYYLDLGDQVSSFTDVSPSQLSTRDLLEAIAIRKDDLHQETATHEAAIDKIEKEITQTQDQQQIAELEAKLTQLRKQVPINFYLQYYRAELHKKFVLSASTFILVFITFPLAYLKLKHGRLFGFALSLITASAYWFMLFFAQLQILSHAIHPAWFMWAPNMVIGIIATLLLLYMRRI